MKHIAAPENLAGRLVLTARRLHQRRYAGLAWIFQTLHIRITTPLLACAGLAIGKPLLAQRSTTTIAKASARRLGSQDLTDIETATTERPQGIEAGAGEVTASARTR